jgi:hypothetical protein
MFTFAHSLYEESRWPTLLLLRTFELSLKKYSYLKIKKDDFMVSLDPQVFLADLTVLSRKAGLYVDLGIGGELTLSAIDPTDLHHWPFDWDKEEEAYRLSPEDGLDEP